MTFYTVMYEEMRLLYQRIYLIEAIHIIPTITVTDKLLVHKAMISVGIMAKKILQLIDSKDHPQ